MIQELNNSRTLTPPQAKLYAAGFRPSDVVRLTGLADSTVRAALAGKAFTPRTQRQIAEAINQDPLDFWGEYLHPSLRVDRDPNVVSKPHLSPIQGESVKSQNAA